MKKDTTQNRVRRSTLVIERDILDAVSEAIREMGFARLSLKEVLLRGNVSSPVIYHHFGTLDKLIDKYVEKHDYWLNQTLHINPESITDPKEYYLSACENVITAFSKNKELQQLFIWEMAESNATTRRTSRKRELATQKLMSRFEEFFQGSDIDIKAVTAVIIGGIYHILLRKDRSTFCNADFSKKGGQERLILAVRTLGTLLYDQMEQEKKTREIIAGLLREGVDPEIIRRVYHREPEIKTDCGA